MKILPRKMLTNVQVLTDEGNVIAVVDEEKKMTIAHQNMRTIPQVLIENYGQWIEVLDLSSNKLRDVSPLQHLPHLNTLILDHNLVTSTTLFPRLPELRVLWLNFNLISEAGLFVPPLARSCPALQHLSLMGNMVAPVMDRRDGDRTLETYRKYVLYHFQDLRFLDDRSVTALERLYCTKVEDPTVLDSVQNFLHSFKTSAVIKFNRKFNSIV